MKKVSLQKENTADLKLYKLNIISNKLTDIEWWTVLPTIFCAKNKTPIDILCKNRI